MRKHEYHRQRAVVEKRRCQPRSRKRNCGDDILSIGYSPLAKDVLIEALGKPRVADTRAREVVHPWRGSSTGADEVRNRECRQCTPKAVTGDNDGPCIHCCRHRRFCRLRALVVEIFESGFHLSPRMMYLWKGKI